MSAILSADDLNDFISPGVACIKPIETLPTKKEDASNPYEVTTEDKVAAANPPPAQISLTDCLACSGCVTSAEAVLVSLQSHTEVLNTLDAHSSLHPPWLAQNGYLNGAGTGDSKIFIASVSPQTRASLAAVYGCTSEEAGNMITQFLSGPNGLASAGSNNSSFLWTIDTNTLRSATLVLAAEEVAASIEESQFSNSLKRPILTSACPGWICYAEKTHPYILPHLSRLKSPQALAGTLLKSILSRKYGIPPDRIWHLALMPCFDKKLEASRGELTSAAWMEGGESAAVRDVDCVITARELITMAAARGIDFGTLSRKPLGRNPRVPFPDPTINFFLFPNRRGKRRLQLEKAAGTSGGYLYHILQRFRAKYPGSRIKIERGRNADVVEHLLVRPREDSPGKEEVLFKAARYYGFRNIQNLVRRLKPKAQSRLLAAAGVKGGARKPGGSVANGVEKNAASDYAYVEVMACPGGCTNGGGQVRVAEVQQLRSLDVASVEIAKTGPQEQREWLGRVDEAYFSASSPSGSEEEADEDDEVMDEAYMNGNGNTGDAMEVDEDTDDIVDGISKRYIHGILNHWSAITDVDKEKLVFTSYRKVESDVGKKSKVSDVDRVAGLASSIGGGW
ncbi:iron hydrogenase [Tothia fuscella]|uniref:Nuclear architecture-related protein 1 n=1 Tax=Tothia fuscella TaxID=1048955 RepID=A0A9P4NIF1_9PEZI|nr:iron hydrogenase [Tothia fuscella]